MAEEADLKPIDNEDPEQTPGYKAPAVKSLSEIECMDQDDESLVKYKQTLLANVDPLAAPKDDSRRVVVEKMAFTVADRPDIVLDLKGSSFPTFTVKEGVEYRIKIFFRVQHEIVSGLKYHHVISRGGLKVDKQSYMVGSYGPKAETQEFLCPADDAPKGMVARGHYKVKSKFIDDDKKVHLAWEWEIDIKKDW